MKHLLSLPLDTIYAVYHLYYELTTTGTYKSSWDDESEIIGMLQTLIWKQQDKITEQELLCIYEEWYQLRGL